MTAKGDHIREASAADVFVLAGLIRRSYRDVADRFQLTPANCPKHPSNCTNKWVKNDLARGVRYFILELWGSPVGTVAIETASADLCYLERLAVLPHERSKGYGRQLVEHVFRTAREHGLKTVSIGIINRQAELKQWYQKIGFTEGDTKEFKHLPFKVCFMTHAL